MSGYQYNQPGYPYGQTPPPPYSSPYSAPPHSAQPYSAPPHSAQPYSAPPNSAQPYSAPPHSAQPYGGPPQSTQPYGGPPPAHTQAHYSTPYSTSSPSAPYTVSDPNKPPKDHRPSAPPSSVGYPPPGPSYGGPFGSSSGFPPGTDPNVVACFQIADQDGSGFIDDTELQRALSSYNQSFSIRTVHLLMYHFTNTNVKKIGPKEFTSVFYSLQNWRSIFDRFDRDRSGKIDSSELRDALLSLGFAVSPTILELLVSKFDKTGGVSKAIEYDNFIECCLTVKGLTEKFKEKDTKYSGSATFTYESFMLTVLPFLIA